MKTISGALVAVAVSLSIAGCSTYKTRLISEPETAKIYVDGEYLGKGQVELDVGREHEWPKSYQIRVKHEHYQTLETTIKNELDPVYGWTGFSIYAGLAAVYLALWAGDPTKNSYLIGSGLIGAMAPLFFFQGNTFKETYSFGLKRLPQDVTHPQPK